MKDDVEVFFKKINFTMNQRSLIELTGGPTFMLLYPCNSKKRIAQQLKK